VLAAPAVGGAALDTEDLVKQVEPSVAVILGDRQGERGAIQGSGCCVSATGLILTAAHLVDDAASYRAIFPSTYEYPLTPAAIDRERDLALFRIVGNPNGGSPKPRPVRIGDASTLDTGAPVLAITAPKRLTWTASTGVVSSTDRTLRAQPVVQTTLIVAEGSSGGPVFDRHGALVGIVFGQLDEFPQGTLVYPINQAYDLLARHGVFAVEPDRRGRALAGAKAPLNAHEHDGEARKRAIAEFNRGVATQSPEEKIRFYAAATELDPGLYEAWFNLGHAYATSGRVTTAIEAYSKAGGLQPEAVEVQRNLGRLYLEQGELDAVLECFSRAAELAPDDPVSRNDLGEIYRRMGRLDDARRQFLGVLELDPRHPFAQFNLALTFLQAGDRAKALEYFQDYLADHPDAPDADRVKAWMARLEKEQS